MQILMVILGMMATKLVALPSDKHLKRALDGHNVEYTMPRMSVQSNPEKEFRILRRDDKDVNQRLCVENSESMNDLVRTYSITPTGEHTDSLHKTSKPSNRLTRVMSEGLPGKHVKRGLHKHFIDRPHLGHGPPHLHHRVIFSPSPLGPPTTSPSSSSSSSPCESSAPRQTIVHSGTRLEVSYLRSFFIRRSWEVCFPSLTSVVAVFDSNHGVRINLFG
ncbi:CSEP0355 putative effector protein [Blumeria hordei DH14]|uniref:CSEP0355 putative effector protein n=1 Tax=Blumeria graminis f. sp. hordei (strain DH14) TaxID=546991 RepID=N1JF94_BLUG1|nr:CSEP0355 putative effector protein [Blumeria hordei DH14]